MAERASANYPPKGRTFNDVRAENARIMIDEATFIGNPYPKNEVERDLAKVKEIQQRPEFVTRIERTLAEDIEDVVTNGAELRGWFGSDAIAVRRTGRYDDYCNHMDLVVSFEDEDGTTLHLGVDTTLSGDYGRIGNKITHSLAPLRRGVLPTVKYFNYLESDGTETRGAQAMPRVILGFTDAETEAMKRRLIEAPEKARTAPAVVDLLYQTEVQLAAQVDYLLVRHGRMADRISGDYAVEALARAERYANSPKLALAPEPRKALDVLARLLRIVRASREEKERALGVRATERSSTETKRPYLVDPEQWRSVERTLH